MPFNIVKIYDTLHLTMRNCYNDKFNLYEKDYLVFIGNMKKYFLKLLGIINVLVYTTIENLVFYPLFQTRFLPLKVNLSQGIFLSSEQKVPT